MTIAETKKSLRSGFTTGACAAAAAKAAVMFLRDHTPLVTVKITLPCGESATFAIASSELRGSSVVVCVVKDAGDDPDVTHRARICATVTPTSTPGIVIDGGTGVARVTRAGLGLALGAPAINPVPKANITAMVQEALEGSPWQGASVVISVPDGEKMAEGTINGRLGLVGGISILGTTGIVRPFSTQAYKKTIETAIAVASASGFGHLVFTTGTRSEKFAMAALPTYPQAMFVQVADHMGDAVHMALRCAIRRIDIGCMIGKLIKLAGGHLATHVKDVDIDLALLARVARQAGIGANNIARIRQALTGRALFDILDREELSRVGRILCDMACHTVKEAASGALDAGCMLFDFDGALVADSANILPSPAFMCEVADDHKRP